MVDLSNFKRVSKSENAEKHAARWYKNEKTGETISRWQYQILQAGGLTPKERAQIRRDMGVPPTPKQKKINQYNALVRAYKAHEAKRLGVSPRKIKVRGKSEQAQKFKRTALTFKDLTPEDRKDKSANGKLARVLTNLGLRQPEWDMPVGESPTT